MIDESESWRPPGNDLQGVRLGVLGERSNGRVDPFRQEVGPAKRIERVGESPNVASRVDGTLS